jgi:hypothetical protein
MKVIVAILGLAAIGLIGFVVAKLQPWMPAEHAVCHSAVTFEGHDFEVWQRKNDSLCEPFATGLFVREGTNDWRVFLLDFQDTYHPKVALRREGSSIVVFHCGDKLGALDYKANTFTRKSDGAVFQAATIGEKPPGNWWLK